MNDAYAAFIGEALIEPIRNVLIVDDDYPTLRDTLVDSPTALGDRKRWRDDPAKYLEVVEHFQNLDPPKLVDVHDYSPARMSDEIAVASRLHQSDLLVLDYELDKSKRGDPTAAAEILRALAKNQHFNLVVVHTVEDLHTAYQELLWRLLSPSPEFILTDDENAKLSDVYDGLESQVEGVFERIAQLIGPGQYFDAVSDEGFIGRFVEGREPYSSLKGFLDKYAPDLPVADRKLILKDGVRRVGERHKPKMWLTGTTDGRLVWSKSGIRWIATENLFVAFSGKQRGADLIDSLKVALIDRRPTPSSLFVARIRAEVSATPILSPSTRVLSNSGLAYWYHNLLMSDEASRRSKISDTIGHHFEDLVDRTRTGLEDFANRLIEEELGSLAGSLESESASAICGDRYGVNILNRDVRRQAELEHNAFVCTKRPFGWHLECGHVFSMNDSVWLCLSPACHLVPGQLGGEWKQTVGSRVPFLAVRLHRRSPSKAWSKNMINSGKLIFLPLEEGVVPFSFIPGNDNAEPVWTSFLADDEGRLSNREGSSETKYFVVTTLVERGPGIVTDQICAEIVGQLRYEYALNFVQKLGSSLTRVGLDFRLWPGDGKDDTCEGR